MKNAYDTLTEIGEGKLPGTIYVGEDGKVYNEAPPKLPDTIFVGEDGEVYNEAPQAATEKPAGAPEDRNEDSLLRLQKDFLRKDEHLTFLEDILEDIMVDSNDGDYHDRQNWRRWG